MSDWMDGIDMGPAQAAAGILDKFNVVHSPMGSNVVGGGPGLLTISPGATPDMGGEGHIR